MMNKQKGNMYPWVTHTWNPIKGKCPHKCSYCYMKRFPQGKLRLDEKCLKDFLGEGNTIFVGSSTDMFCEDICESYICNILDYCKRFPDNEYLFQTKNPMRYYKFVGWFPKNTILGVTLESNKNHGVSLAQDCETRSSWMREFKKYTSFKMFVSIEPIMDFDFVLFHNLIKQIEPSFVSIGADSGNNNLPEPSEEKIKELIEELEKFTQVKIKDNMKRLGEFG